jgi:hypothetical protein
MKRYRSQQRDVPVWW